jgi:peptidoglycan/LPS O-acetylase OafA/YrhL
LHVTTRVGNTPVRFLELDALRGLAALAVVVFHYTTRYDNLYGHPPLVPDFRWGEYGVQLFFIISGFVIFMTLERTRSSRDFLVSRASRLYPVYWAAVIVTFVVTTVFSLPGLENTPFEALVNLTMLQRLFGVPHVDDAYWTLTVELAFYGLMWLAFVTRQLGRIEMLGALWLLLMVVTEALSALTGFAPPRPVANFLLLTHGNLFFAGILFYRLHRGTASRFAPLLVLLCLGVQPVVSSLEAGVVVALFFGLFWLFRAGHLRFLVVKPLLFLGTISYSLYVLHQNLGYVVMRELYAVGTPVWLTFGVTFALILALASLFTFYIEQPALRAIRQAYAKVKASRRFASQVPR